MGFMGKGGLLGGLADALKGKAGEVGGSSFPKGTYVTVRYDSGEVTLAFVYPSKEEETITHSMVKCATILAMGVINIEKDNRTNATVLVHGTKYLVVLNDGRQAVITAGLGENAYMLESVLF